MRAPGLLGRLVDALRPRRLPVWYHTSYRFPVADLREAIGIEPRRADLALWALLATRARRRVDVHEPSRAGYDQLALVHERALLESLTRPATLAAAFGLHREDFPVDGVMTTIRLAVGGTIAATRHVLAHGGPAMNLLGGFHHAAPGRAAGLCPVNDVAIAIAVARREGFTGRVVVLDLDAHPPDGTAACLVNDPSAWIGSLSGSDWGPLPGVDETVLTGADDATYLAALDRLLARAPRPALAYVLAGDDVLAGDRLGKVALTEAGVRARDERVAAWLGDTPAVWVPAGGYHERSWRLLAGTTGALLRPPAPLPRPDLDPVATRFAFVSRGLDPATLTGPEPWITQEEVDALLGGRGGHHRLLGYYTAEGIEAALDAYGFLPTLSRLGYGAFHVELDRTGTGDRARLTGAARGERHLLWELVLSRERLGDADLLFVQWMTMRHPLGTFETGRRRLPGQEVPGLGMSEEAVHLLLRMCDRLDLDGLMLRPAWFHTAAMGSRAFTFVDPEVQGSFEAMLRDLGGAGLAAVTDAFAEDRVRRDGVPWAWQPEPMVLWRTPHPRDEAAIAAVRDAHRFTLESSTPIGAASP